MPEQLIRVYMKDDEGNLYDTRESLDNVDFCGSAPRVGDMIVSPWLRNSNEEARLWSNRTVQIVEAVYFLPGKRRKPKDDAWAVIVVKERQMTEAEWALL